MANEPEKAISPAELEDDFIRCFREELKAWLRTEAHDEAARKWLAEHMHIVEE